MSTEMIWPAIWLVLFVLFGIAGVAYWWFGRDFRDPAAWRKGCRAQLLGGGMAMCDCEKPTRACVAHFTWELDKLTLDRLEKDTAALRQEVEEIQRQALVEWWTDFTLKSARDRAEMEARAAELKAQRDREARQKELGEIAEAVCDEMEAREITKQRTEFDSADVDVTGRADLGIPSYPFTISVWMSGQDEKVRVKVHPPQESDENSAYYMWGVRPTLRFHHCGLATYFRADYFVPPPLHNVLIFGAV